MLGPSAQLHRYSTGVRSGILCWTWQAFTGFCRLFQSESKLWFQTSSEI